MLQMVERCSLKAILLLLLTILVTSSAMAEKVLVILPHNYGTNYFLARDVMDDFGWEVTLTGTTNPVQPCPWADNIAASPIEVDLLVQDIDLETISNYDAVIVSSAHLYVGTPYGDLMDSPDVINLLVRANQEGVVLAGWCGATRVFAAADIINGRNVTGNEVFEDEYINAGANYVGPDHSPVTDGNLVTTTRGMYFRLQNVEAVADAIQARIWDEATLGGAR